MVVMAKCSLGYDGLVEAIENGDCGEALRVSKNPLNKHAVLFRHGGVSYCYSTGCPHAESSTTQIEFKDLQYSLTLHEKEEKMIKAQGWDFLLNEKYVHENTFYPMADPMADGYLRYTGFSHVRCRPQSFFAEEGDIRVFEDFDEYDGGVQYRPPTETAKKIQRAQGRTKQLLKRISFERDSKTVRFDSDRFSTVQEDEIDENSCHCGVIIKHPDNTPFIALDKVYQNGRYGHMTDYVERELPFDAEIHIQSRLGSEALFELRRKPTRVSAIFLEHKIYLSQFHPKQTRLEIGCEA